MQQVGALAAHIAAKIFSVMPKFGIADYFPEFTVRRKYRIRMALNGFLLFILPIFFIGFGYNYVQGRGGLVEAIAEFGHLKLQQVNLKVYQDQKVAHHVDWHVDPEAIKAVLPISVGDSMLNIDPDTVRRTVTDVPWVKSATVKLILPSTLSVTVKEQKPFALWQRDEMFYLIDETGTEITNQNLERYDYLPWVVGYGANTRIYEYAALMNDYASIFQHVKSAYRVGNRRWTLVTNNGIEISLSETNPRASLEYLIKLEKKQNVLAQPNIMAIDLRIAGKAFVKQKNATTLSIYSGMNT